MEKLTEKAKKGAAEHYSIRYKDSDGWGVWGDITLLLGEESVQVMAHTDYGSYSYYWSHCGMNPKEFMTTTDKHYTMKKLAGNSLMVPDFKNYRRHLVEQLLDYRKQGVFEKEEAREIWDGIHEDHWIEHEDTSLIWERLTETDWFSKLYEDWDCGFPDKMKPAASDFFDKIWLPFTEALKGELAAAQVAAA